MFCSSCSSIGEFSRAWFLLVLPQLPIHTVSTFVLISWRELHSFDWRNMPHPVCLHLLVIGRYFNLTCGQGTTARLICSAISPEWMRDDAAQDLARQQMVCGYNVCLQSSYILILLRRDNRHLRSTFKKGSFLTVHTCLQRLTPCKSVD